MRENSSKLFIAREDAGGKLSPRVFASFHLPWKPEEKKINKNVLTDVDLKIKINKDEVLYTKRAVFWFS